jgi:hypothetical protein
VSEYQYYEFQAIDRPLTEREMRELRSCSSRATITATRFVNHYNFGSFKGDPSTWMEKYFDAFLYLANWGTHDLRIRLPRRVLDLDTARLYCRGEAAVAHSQSDFIILEFLSESDDRGGWDDEDESGWLSSLIPLRADLAAGDHRALYLAWLLCVQEGELADDAAEPPIPGGLGVLNAPLRAFADFLRIDDDLITVAAARSPRANELPSDKDFEKWLAALSDEEKNGWLRRFASGREPHLGAELLLRFRGSRPIPRCDGEAPRTVGELLAAAGQHAKERCRQEAERAAAERARRERDEAEARERHLESLARRGAKVWLEVEELIATKQPGKYDEAVKLLCDLRDLGLRRGRKDEVEARLLRLREEHARKPSFVERLKKAGLGKLGA